MRSYVFFFSICFNVIAVGFLGTYGRVNAWMNASWFEHDGITMNNNNSFIFIKNVPPKKTNNKNLHIVPPFCMSVVIRKRTVLMSRVGLPDPCHYSSCLFHRAGLTLTFCSIRNKSSVRSAARPSIRFHIHMCARLHTIIYFLSVCMVPVHAHIVAVVVLLRVP